MSTLDLIGPIAAPRRAEHVGARVSGACGALIPAVVLTGREVVVLTHLSREATLEEIAATLWVTRNTVKSQVRSLYLKLGVSSRTGAVAWARSVGLY